MLAIHTGLRECWTIRVTDRRRADKACTEPMGAERLFQNGSHTGEDAYGALPAKNYVL